MAGGRAIGVLFSRAAVYAAREGEAVEVASGEYVALPDGLYELGALLSGVMEVVSQELLLQL